MAGGYQRSAEQQAADNAALAELRARLNRRVDQLVPQLLPGARRAGHFWEVGGLDGQPGQSLKINRSGAMVGFWTQFNAQAGEPGRSGQMLDLVVLKKYFGRFGEAMKDLRSTEGLVAVNPEERARFEAEGVLRQAQQERETSAQEAKKRSRAQALWHGAVPIHGTPAEAYLQGRVPGWRALERWPGSLRYRPDVGCPVRSHYPNWQGFPALLACVLGPDGEIVACHRTYLDIAGWDHASKSGRVTVHKLVRLHDREVEPFLLDPASPPDPKAIRSIKSHKATLGRYARASGSDGGGGYIPLRKGKFGDVGRGKRLKDIPAGTIVHFAEGIEDALNYGVDHLDEWIGAAVSLANMANVWVPDQAGGICFLADRDPAENTEALDSFEAAVAAQQARAGDGGFVRAVWPAPGFKDFSDQAVGKRLL